PLDVLQSLVVQCECLSTEAPVLVFRPAIFDSDVAAFDETCFVEAAPECRQLRRVCLRGCRAKKPDDQHRRLLRPRRQRPRSCRAAQTADEVSTSDWTAQHVFSTLPVGTIITVSPGTVPVLG